MNEQAKEAGARADELIKQLQAEQQQESGNTDIQQSTPAETEPKADGAPVVQEHPDKSELDKLRQKYSVLEGKYRSEVPRLHSALREQQERYESQIAELKQQAEQAKTEPNYFSDIAEEFGEETANKLQDSFDKMLQDKIKPQNEPVPDQSVDHVSQGKIQYVMDMVGGQQAFNSIDNDPGFNAWLDQYDQYTGKQRRQILQEHFSSGRLNETAEMYRSWSSQQQPQQPQQQTQQQQILEEQIQPGSVQSAQNTQQGKRIYTSSEYKELMTEISRNQSYRRTEAGRQKAEAIRSELDAALAEGRIRNDIEAPDATDPYRMNHG